MAQLYPQDFERKIGFDKIRDLLIGFCLGEPGRLKADEIRFMADHDHILEALEQTQEFKDILLSETHFPDQNYYDLREELLRLRIEGTWPETDVLYDMVSSLKTVGAILDFFQKKGNEEYPRLHLLASAIFSPEEIISEAERIMDERGNIRDNASEKLADIRKNLQKKITQAGRKIQQSLDAARSGGYISGETEMTIRNGRTVIPVPATHKRKVKGVIHDESATGQTVYIEPLEVFEANNEIRELELEERKEIIKTLTLFADFLRPFLEDLAENYAFLGLIDMIRAKARLAIQLQAHKPRIEDQSRLQWIKARHPLLWLSFKNQDRQVVPLNLDLDQENRILIISGPNAGGKSVCLKTVGLLQYMLQCGLLVPMNDSSETGIFENIFIDIGDEQSLENDLSTYSSHLLNIKFFLEHANKRSLFLIDEFGTGTDPQLGGAIAEASLLRLNEMEASGIVTTHYANLKLLADSHEGLINGAMAFDNKRLQPLYQLKTGKPGSSFAFEIARKTGFPEYVLKDAAEKTGKSLVDFEEQLAGLDEEKLEINRKQKELEITDELLSETLEKYRKLSSEIQGKKKEIIAEARAEAKQILAQANKMIENTIREIRENQAEQEKTKAIRKKLETEKKELLTSVSDIPETKRRTDKKPKAVPKKKEPKDQITIKEGIPEVGDQVIMSGQSMPGEVMEIKGKNTLVRFGSIKIRCKLDALKKISRKEARKEERKEQGSRYSGILDSLTEKRVNFPLSLDIRGKKVEEVIPIMQEYVDNAVLLSIKELRILHGKGYGVLRQHVRDYLRSREEVERFHDEHIERGGSGITIAYLF